MSHSKESFIPVRQYIQSLWPANSVRLPQIEAFDHIWMQPPVVQTEPSISVQTALLFETSLTIGIPGLDAVNIVIVPEGNATQFMLKSEANPIPKITLIDLPIALRFNPDLLKPVRRVPGQNGGPETWEVDPNSDHVDITLAKVTLSSDSDGNISLKTDLSINMPPMMIGNSGIVIEAQNIRLYLDTKDHPKEKPVGWRGVYIEKAAMHLPGGLSQTIGTLAMTKCYIGNGGFTGTVDHPWTPGLSATIFGMQCSLENVAIKFVQNSLTAASMEGMLTVPFFDKALHVDIGLSLNGNFSIKLRDPPGVLTTLYKPGILSVAVNSLGFGVSNRVVSVHVSGEVTPLFGKEAGLEWPTLEVKDLSIDSEGNVHLNGGWLDLPNQYSLDFHGFKIEITKMGFGKTDDAGKWIGFSGNLKLVDGLAAGGSVEGLRIIWYDDDRSPRITLNGVGVEFEVPDVLRFKGDVSYRTIREILPKTGDIHRFDGAIKLELMALDMTIDGTLVIGYDKDEVSGESYTFFAIHLDTELPAGIPLWSTGLALYGMAGLFALEMEPDKHEDEEWYGVDETHGWYHRPTTGVTDLKKWTNRSGSLALGAGVTIGTLPDNGFIFSGKTLLAIVFPGPILLIEGKANLLQERAKLSGGDPPLFRALAVLDARAGTFLIGLDAQYKFDKAEGSLIDLHGGAEAYFSLSDASAWHLYLGQKDPTERRIRAQIFKLFEANTYLMLDSNQLALGAWIGYDKSWKFGPLRVVAQAWIEGNAMVSWKPAHFYADIWLHGSVELRIWRFGLGLSVDARISADVFKPFHLVGEFSVGISLPWPLPKFHPSIRLEWPSEPAADMPQLPVPVKEITLEHLKVSTGWPLPRQKKDKPQLLLPNYDSNDDGFLEAPVPLADEQDRAPPPADNIPVVPLDIRPHITFGRPVHDDAIGKPVVAAPPAAEPTYPVSDYERIGDPAKNEGPARVRYSLKEVALFKWVFEGSPPTWKIITRTGPDATRDLWGSWAPIPGMPDAGGTDVAKVKLMLWSKTAFNYTRHTGRSWDEWFTDRFSEYPCVPAAPDREVCCNFQAFAVGEPWKEDRRNPNCLYFSLSFFWPEPTPSPGGTYAPPVTAPVELMASIKLLADRVTHALCFSGKLNYLVIKLVTPANTVRISIVEDTTEGPVKVKATWVNVMRKEFPPITITGTMIEILGDKLIAIRLESTSRFCVVQICAIIGADPVEVTRREEMAKHTRDELEHWSHEDEILEPHTTYRLKVNTELHVIGEEELSKHNETLEQTEFVYFGTEGPPGLANLSIPIGTSNKNAVTLFDLFEGNNRMITVDGLPSLTPVFKTGLNCLEPYVRQTVPATVPDVGKKPLLPRPVYRGYDLGVEFNENYVDLMYRVELRDLGLYLYNSNNQPVRDAQGRLIIYNNRWGKTGDLTLKETEKLWIRVVNSSDCAYLDTTKIPRDKTLSSVSEGQVLDADTVYEARLIPLLLHESFSSTIYPPGSSLSAKGPSGTLGRWNVWDMNVKGPVSNWEIKSDGDSTYIIQTSDTSGGTKKSITDAVKPGTLLLYGDNPSLPKNHPEQPGNWTDYRVSVYAHAEEGDALGIVFRYHDINNYYRFSMDREGKYRRLCRIHDGSLNILAEDDFVYLQNQDYLITVEAVGPSIHVYQDGQRIRIFDIIDNSIVRGGIGLYSWGKVRAHFSDIRVDDLRSFPPPGRVDVLRSVAPAVYKFKFTTSQFTNFFHHMHSFQDELSIVKLPAETNITTHLAEAILSTAAKLPSTEKESRAYENLVSSIPLIGQQLQPIPQQVKIVRIEQDDQILAFMFYSPEPIDWTRTELSVSCSEQHAILPKPPGLSKLTDVSFGTKDPNEESVTMLLREVTDIGGHSIEYSQLPGPIREDSSDQLMLVDDFEDDNTAGSFLFNEEFGTNALDHCTIVSEPDTHPGSPVWLVSEGAWIKQTSDIAGGDISADIPDKPGTIALTGSASWSNIRIRVTMHSDDDDAIGIVFRYKDTKNYYRFSMDKERSYRRLIKKVDGIVKILWEDNVAYTLGLPYTLTIEAYNGDLFGYTNDLGFVNNQLFSVQDPDLNSGQVGLYCWANTGAYFDELFVESLHSPPILWKPMLKDLSEFNIVEEDGTKDGSSLWAAGSGTITQSSGIYVDDSTEARPGTYVLGGNPGWQDMEISVHLRSNDNGDIGVMFRYQDKDNYYRFSIGWELTTIGRTTIRTASIRRVIKKVDGFVAVLLEERKPFAEPLEHDVTLRAVGSRIECFLDGKPLLTGYDASLTHGMIGLYCWANPSAQFEKILVTNLSREIGIWKIHDEGTIHAPSKWSVRGNALLQLSEIGGGSIPDHGGTYAVAGEQDWKDYRFKVRLRSDSGQSIGVIFRYTDDNNYYHFSMNSKLSYRRLIKKTNGYVTKLWDDYRSYIPGKPFTLIVDVIGTKLVAHEGNIKGDIGTRIFEVDDIDHSAGKIGLFSWADDGSRFERVEVSVPPLESYALYRDKFTNGSMGEWSIRNEGTLFGPSLWKIVEGRLLQTSNIASPPDDRETLDKKGTYAIAGDTSWTDVIVSVKLESMDDDCVGIMFRYKDPDNYYRFSMDKQRNYRRLVKNVDGKFTLLWEDSTGYEMGQIYDFIVTLEGNELRGYMYSIPMFVARDNDLTAGAIGLYSWGNIDSRFSGVRVFPATRIFKEWLLNDPFDFLVPDRWTFVNEGDQAGPSNWEVTEGELRQTSNITGNPRAISEVGTYALAGNREWTDYSISVRLRSIGDGSIGVIFRYYDKDNYYLFSMNRTGGYRRLIRCVQGILMKLWDDHVAYTYDRNYVITINCVGEKIQGHIDGRERPLFTVHDSSLIAGKIGLYCSANKGACFDEVRIAPPVWASFYTFEEEQPLPAGTCIRVCSGNYEDMPSEKMTVDHKTTWRFAATLDDHGRLRFPEDKIDLRIHKSKAEVGHTRRFLNNSNYKPVGTDLLRNADGTAMFIILHSDFRRPGLYRLRFIYRLDNSGYSTDPRTQKLSEGGSSESEVVTLDIPWESYA